MEKITLLEARQIVLGVTGSIAAYKAVDLASKLTQAGARVDVILTHAAQQFVTPLTFEAVTGRAVYTDLWRTSGGGLPTHIAHVGLAEQADLMIIAPATADAIARLAHGFASDLLGVTALALRCPLLVAPAMDGAMYTHAATQTNIDMLQGRGVHIILPEEGRFASGLTGVGRLPETPTLLGEIRRALAKQHGALAGRRVIVTAGGTREAIDPVRYIGNRSSGKQGYALAQAALDAGAEVTLITTVGGLPAPFGAHVIHVESAQAMLDAVLEAISAADALLMAAAVADFRPRQRAEQKIKKTEANVGGLEIALERTPDILAAVKAQREATGSPRVVVGFAAESENLLENARDKMLRKGVDLLAANDISAKDAGFAADTNRVTLLSPSAPDEALPLMSKTAVAERIIMRVAALLGGGT